MGKKQNLKSAYKSLIINGFSALLNTLYALRITHCVARLLLALS